MPWRHKFASNEEYNAWYREYNAKNAEKKREYNRVYNKAWRKRNKDYSQEKSRLKYPEKEHCRYLTLQAIRKGILTRKPCETCGKPNGQAHHDDYLKPLDVKWFCPLHHRRYEINKLKVDNSNNTTI